MMLKIPRFGGGFFVWLDKKSAPQETFPVAHYLNERNWNVVVAQRAGNRNHHFLSIGRRNVKFRDRVSLSHQKPDARNLARRDSNLHCVTTSGRSLSDLEPTEQNAFYAR